MRGIVSLVLASLLTACSSVSSRENYPACHFSNSGGRRVWVKVIVVRAELDSAWIIPRDRREWKIGLDGTPIEREVARSSIRPCPDESMGGASEREPIHRTPEVTGFDRQ